MTLEELNDAIELLNENFKGKTMKPLNLPIREFIAGPQYADALPKFMVSYFQVLGDKEKLSKLIDQEEGWIIYGVFDKGNNEDFIPENLSFVPVPEFLQANDIDLQLFVHQKEDRKEAL